jgi:hypothetical protein
VPGPDPSLSAEISCAGGLDPVLFQVIAPFWSDLLDRRGGSDSYLWLVRDGTLKVRIHGAESEVPRQRRLLEERAASCALVWTVYERSHLSLGGGPFLGDDHYVSLLTRCLGNACALVLSLRPGEDGALPHRLRQIAHLQGLIVGLAALGFPPEKRASYLAYHRDWLLRFLTFDQLPRTFEERIDRMGSALDPIRTLAQNGGDIDLKGMDRDWRRSLAELLEYVTPFSGNPAYQLDPYATDPAFSPLFKVFHGLGNQLGLSMADEAFAHHLLLRASAGS